MSRSGEFEIIERLLAPLAGEGAFSLSDDAAVLPELSHGEAWVATKDAMVAGVHFLADDPPDLIARKLVRVNLSDLAAMGASPMGYLLAFALSPDCDDDWLEAFVAGLAEDQRIFGIALYGGDTVSTPGPVTLSLTALGRVERGRELRRNGARAGDAVYVSGSVGDAALGLKCLQEELAVSAGYRKTLVDRYRLPEARVRLGPALIGSATACQDVSDGLAADLGHIARRSGAGMEIEADLVPISQAARAAIAAGSGLETLPFTGGDDYELVFTAPVDAVLPDVGVPLTRIGRVVAGDGVRFMSRGGEISLRQAGWRHF
ncbi:thiamine-phosphate kinase [Minwuia thermotolerans]|uniref:Thiamine-monophosphate kinase n=1 Tax=Minwuia thermotolerans TaxID=2056226 RepID=A0A2M9FZ09_9PROT|nr:thiamine-phosphate kinase [Minwuia thermotolerans]PJK28692.1 thiamine-phosphate kinase [Minwuia thermotolerans]